MPKAETLDRSEAFEKGLALRSSILGKNYVEKAIERAENDPFYAPIQQFATEYCFGKLWSRNGLELKYRSIITLAILGTLGMEDELALHIRAAIRNGVSRDEIKEALLHVALYAGMPRGTAAFRAARAVFDGAAEDGNPSPEKRAAPVRKARKS